MPWPEAEENTGQPDGALQGSHSHSHSPQPVAPAAGGSEQPAESPQDQQLAPGGHNGAIPAGIVEGKQNARAIMGASELPDGPAHAADGGGGEGGSVGGSGSGVGGGDGDGDEPTRQGGASSPPQETSITNGNGVSRKRSRSGSIIQSTAAAPTTTTASAASPVIEDDGLPRKTPLDKVLLEDYLYREWGHTSLAATRNTHQEVLRQKLQERDYYLALNQERQVNPAAIFGPGYEGYGNTRTDLRSQHPQLLYPSNRRRPGGRKAKELRIPREDMLTQSDQDEHLVPIRLDIDWEKVKVRDTFTWNLHDRVTPVDVFAEKLVEDLGLPLETSGPLVRQITQSIHEQLADFYPQVFIEEEPLDPHLPYSAYKNDELRVLIKLNITIGQHTLIDQFEWELNDPHNSPEGFAIQMSQDLSLPGEFTTAIAHSIREQVQLFTKSLYVVSYPFDGRPIDDPDLRDAFQPSPIPSTFRPFNVAKEYTPYLYELNEAELDRTEGSISREQRRQKRVNRRGGPILPELKDRQRTIRTMIVSSVIPGCASSIEESRLFKRSSTSRRGRTSTGHRDGLEDSDSSESEESSIGSPAISRLNQGTARTRGMRQASSMAQSAIRGQMGRSATPETTVSHSHETRTSARRQNYREESSEAPENLIVKLKINPDKLRRLMRDLKSGSRQYTGSPGGPSTTPTGKSSARGSMGPPPSQGQPASATKKPTNPPQFHGVIDAPHPLPPGTQPPPPPQWLIQGLVGLKRQYPNDSFEGTMRYTAVDPNTNLPIPNAAQTHPGQKLPYKYFPRIRCNDCPGKLYTPGPAMTVENFEVHLKNRNHKEAVAARLAREKGGSGPPPVRRTPSNSSATKESSAPAGTSTSAGNDSSGAA
ncbi:SWI-SNF complex subunit Snf5 [Trichophyton tonsurans CBS 112818]|uniref:SWI-SNF complex subunit Snf5 n=1 Tax=Trichophyton tonsurans (strain CBS 112818) TaxID=647933 RepID=F2S1S2_TRIT1|nr:SWI-SNF complex subunit Snf5 [Trichophyton tonsurans CBS 112818]